MTLVLTVSLGGEFQAQLPLRACKVGSERSNGLTNVTPGEGSPSLLDSKLTSNHQASSAQLRLSLSPGDTGQSLGTCVVVRTEGVPDIKRVGARDAVQQPTLPRTASQRMIWPQRPQCQA